MLLSFGGEGLFHCPNGSTEIHSPFLGPLEEQKTRRRCTEMRAIGNNILQVGQMIQTQVLTSIAGLYISFVSFSLLKDRIATYGTLAIKLVTAPSYATIIGRSICQMYSCSFKSASRATILLALFTYDVLFSYVTCSFCDIVSTAPLIHSRTKQHKSDQIQFPLPIHGLDWTLI